MMMVLMGVLAYVGLWIYSRMKKKTEAVAEAKAARKAKADAAAETMDGA